VIGDDNYFMNYTHVGHDNRIGSRVTMANSAVLAGHVEVGNYAIIGAFNAIHQFCRVGAYAFLGAYTGCRQDVLPFCRTDGLDAKTYGLNTIGLKRNGFSDERIEALQKAYRFLVKSKLNTSQALERISAELRHPTSTSWSASSRQASGASSRRSRRPRGPRPGHAPDRVRLAIVG
jgi:UDP-N-acetylglucosamine acyltransferase